jgi:anti-sigma B factor antagonist
MITQTEKLGDIFVIHLKSEIFGGGDASAVHDLVHEELEKGTRYFVLDLSGVKLVNSSGVGILIGALTAVRNQGGDLRLAHLNEKVSSILEMMNLNRVFQIFQDVETARKSFSQ